MMISWNATRSSIAQRAALVALQAIGRSFAQRPAAQTRLP
jgi:hypothetical protein